MATVTSKNEPKKPVCGIDNLVVGKYYWSIDSEGYVLCTKSDVGRKMIVFLYSGLAVSNPTDYYIEHSGELIIETD